MNVWHYVLCVSLQQQLVPGSDAFNRSWIDRSMWPMGHQLIITALWKQTILREHFKRSMQTVDKIRITLYSLYLQLNVTVSPTPLLLVTSSLPLCLWQSEDSLNLSTVSSTSSLLPCRCSPFGGGIRAPSVRRHRLPLQQHSPHSLASCLPLPVLTRTRQRASWCGLWKREVPGREPSAGHSEWCRTITTNCVMLQCHLQSTKQSFICTVFFTL